MLFIAHWQELTDFIPEMPLAFSSLINALNCQHVKSQIAIALLYVLQRLFIFLASKSQDLWEKYVDVYFYWNAANHSAVLDLHIPAFRVGFCLMDILFILDQLFMSVFEKEIVEMIFQHYC